MSIQTLISEFDKKFWCTNIMELVERWAYYGVRMILSIYIVSAASLGGLEFTHIQKGEIYSGWALIQSILPILVGGYPDRFGYKKTISFAIILKIIGYVLMATQTSFPGFFAGCLLLAAGTAIFKPAVQGVLASSLDKKTSSLGWGIFYWLINVGGFMGPWLAGYLRILDWKYVFYGNALIVSLNFIMLFICPPLPREAQSVGSTFVQQSISFFKLPLKILKEMFSPALISFLLIYSGFWMMYYQIFDLLPNFIDDWVDSSGLLLGLGKTFNVASWIEAGSQGKQIPPEWLISLNTGTIILLMIPTSWIFRKVNPFVSMVVGIVVTLLGMLIFGSSQLVTLCAVGIVIFSIGEMGASPRMREYLGLIAPPDKKAQYMGYANLPEAIGWGFGSLVAGYWYEVHSDKHNLAKQFLLQKLNWSQEAIKALSKEEILPSLASALNLSQNQLTKTLWNYAHPEKIWYWFIFIGLGTAFGLVIHYYLIPNKFKLKEEPSNQNPQQENILKAEV
ncbi:MAG: MFS transporter [Candidatus Caenarcaniphilales bacterium]|nr:MFS transporter [Candidatus Caenarcaniphilales bacterium]